ncbi:AraC family transcriptional regulator [Streptomyces sp. NPDC055056]
MDPLDDILNLLRASGSVTAKLSAGGNWAVHFDGATGPKFNAVTQGTCVLTMNGLSRPLVLQKGDCYLLTRPVSYTLYSHGGVAPVKARDVFHPWTPGTFSAQVGTDTNCTVVGGAFSFAGRSRQLLLDQLPSLIHVPVTSAYADGINQALAWMSSEAARGELGHGLVSNQMAIVMLVHVLRHHLQVDHKGRGWLAGLADPVVGPVLRALHTQPAHPWTLRELAAVAAVSRSTLAARFKAVVGTSPLEYLTNWRIELASNRLIDSQDTVSAIAHNVGYSSESSLSIAFKRVIGVPPGAYRRLNVLPVGPDHPAGQQH